MSGETAEQLLSAVARGDRAAFRLLYAATAPRILGVVRRLMRDPARAEDVVQETFVRVWQNAARFDAAKGPALPWLVTIARRLAIDELRRSGPPARSIDDPALNVDALVADIVEPDPMGGGRLRHCLEHLRDEYRQVVVLAHVQGLTYDELAQRFDRPIGTIKTWVHRGLADLKACIG